MMPCGNPAVLYDNPNLPASKSHVFGAFVVHAPWQLPNLLRAEGRNRSAIIVDWAASGPPPGIAWVHHWTSGENEILLSFARDSGGYWLRVPGHADFQVWPHSREVQVWPTRDSLDGLTLEHLLVDQILPRVAAQLGATMIHASVVQIRDRTVLFIGPSGWGKSTLAGLLHGAGHAVLSDDCAQLIVEDDGAVRVVPTYPSLRLTEESMAALFPDDVSSTPVASYSNKRRIAIAPPGQHGQSMMLDALYLLGAPDQASDCAQITSITPAAACLALIRHSFRLDLFDREASALQLRRCGVIAEAVSGFRLDYPRDHARSRELVKAVVDHVASLPSPAPLKN